MSDKTHVQKEPQASLPDQQETQRASLTEAEIASYQALFRDEYGIELTTDQALEKGLRFVRLLKVVLQATADHKGINNPI